MWPGLARDARAERDSKFMPQVAKRADLFAPPPFARRASFRTFAHIIRGLDAQDRRVKK
jgi:hypothetical protein